MKTVKLSDVVKRANTKEDRFNTSLLYYVGGEHIETDNVVIKERGLIKGSTIGPMFYFGFKKGDVLLVSRNPHLRKSGMVSFDGICSEKTFVLETNDERILLQDYLPFIFQSDHFWEYAESHKSGSVNFFLNWSTLANYEFILPELDEQKKLAEVLWQIVDTMESYKKLLAKTDEMVKAKFNELLLKNERTCKIRDYVELPITKITKDTKFDEIQYIDISSIDKDLRIIQGTTNYQLNNAPSRAQQIVKKNDILISTVRPNLKTFAIINLEADNLIASTGFCVLRVQKCPLYYLYGIINSDIFTNQMISEATGISYPAVNDGNILNFKIPDISEEQQKYLADLVAKTEESKAAIQTSLNSLSAVYKKIIAENLGGR